MVKTAIKLLLVFIEYNESNYLILLGNIVTYFHSIFICPTLNMFPCNGDDGDKTMHCNVDNGENGDNGEGKESMNMKCCGQKAPI